MRRDKDHRSQRGRAFGCALTIAALGCSSCGGRVELGDAVRGDPDARLGVDPSAEAGVSGRPDGAVHFDAAPDAAGPEAACEAVCDKMGGLVFPLAFCEDFGGHSAGADFCDEGALRTQDTCATFCRRVLAASPDARCRAAWSPVQRCIIASGSYERFFLDFAFESHSCAPDVLEMKSACWWVAAARRERHLWTEQRPAAYTFRFTHWGDGLMDQFNVEVTVVGDRVSSPPAPPAVPTVDQIFDAIDACADRTGESVSFEYDPVLHFPTAARCERPDERSGAAVWRFYGVENFAPLP
jgi:hypothetical protein